MDGEYNLFYQNHFPASLGCFLYLSLSLSLSIRPHSSLKGHSPFAVAHNTEAASDVARHMAGQRDQQQREASKYFSSVKRKEFQINSSVFIKTKRPQFYKHSSLFFPNYEKDVYRITDIDKRFFPWAYTVVNTNTNKIKHLYAFEMRRIQAPTDETFQGPLTRRNSTILVHDVVFREESRLRSGLKIPNKNVVFYRVTIDKKEDILSAESLRLLVRSLGDGTLTYGPFFRIPGNEKYHIDT